MSIISIIQTPCVRHACRVSCLLLQATAVALSVTSCGDNEDDAPGMLFPKGAVLNEIVSGAWVNADRSGASDWLIGLSEKNQPELGLNGMSVMWNGEFHGVDGRVMMVQQVGSATLATTEDYFNRIQVTGYQWIDSTIKLRNLNDGTEKTFIKSDVGIGVIKLSKAPDTYNSRVKIVVSVYSGSEQDGEELPVYTASVGMVRTEVGRTSYPFLIAGTTVVTELYDDTGRLIDTFRYDNLKPNTDYTISY